MKSAWQLAQGGVTSTFTINNETLIADSGTYALTNDAVIKAGDVVLSQIQFGKNYTLNNSSSHAIINEGWLQADNFEDTDDTFFFDQIFPNLNFTTLKSIEMDPDISVNFPTNPSSSNTGLELWEIVAMIGLVSVCIIVVTLIIKKKRNN